MVFVGNGVARPFTATISLGDADSTRHRRVIKRRARSDGKGWRPMPNFDLVPMDEAIRMTASGRRSRIIREYADYIDRLEPGQAGRLRPAKGETVQAVRRRLGKASKLTDRKVNIKRVGEDIFFWLKSEDVSS